MKTLFLGNVPLDDTPRIALALRDTEDLAQVRVAVDGGVDILEFRIDQFRRVDAEYIHRLLKRFDFAPRLLTIRSALEAGLWQGSESARAELFEALMPVAEAVDIELSATTIRDRVIGAAHDAGLPVIGSHHDFEATPSMAVLDKLAEEARVCGADILKIATTCSSGDDLRKLARFTLSQHPAPVIVIGMGTRGTASRLFFPALGSRLTYTFLGEPTAPGQLNCGDMLKYRMALYPVVETGTGD